MSAGSRRRRAHIRPERTTAPRCPSCGKVWAGTQEDAERYCRQVGQYKGGSQAVRFYQAHGGWHWTRRGAA